MADEPERTYAVTIPARPAGLQSVHDLLARLWQGRPVDEVSRNAFATAVAEIAANIVQHLGDERAHVELRLRSYPALLEAEFTDNGPASGADACPPEMPAALAESGRGLALARACLDELVYERRGPVNRWELRRRL